MTRKPFNRTPLAIVLQVASLLVVAAGVFGILISDISRHGTTATTFVAPAKMHLLAWPPESNGFSR